MTVGGNNVKCHGDVGTPTAHLETAKPLFNSVISHPSAKCMTIDLANFYLITLMKYYECLRVKLKHVPQEIIDENKLHQFAHNDWVHTEIRRGAYGLPQAAVLAHEQLTKWLN